MGLRPRRGLSLCAGGGGLDMGLELAEPGFATRCYVERDEYCQRVIVAAQRAGYFAPAPIWDDLTNFDGRPWRGHIDTVLAGYPCQPFSHAGGRRGASDERHLWPEVARIVGEVRPRWVFLENVAGHVSLGLDDVLRDLERLRYTPACGLFSSEAAGGRHRRERVFIVAHAGCPERRSVDAGGGNADRYDRWREKTGRAGKPSNDIVAHSERLHSPGRRKPEDMAGPPGNPEGDSEQRQRRGDAADDRIDAMGDGGGRSERHSPPCPTTSPHGPPSSITRPISRRLFRSAMSSAPAIVRRRWLRKGSWRKRRLNPSFVEWLMRWPDDHALCACSATASIRWQRLMRGALSRLPTDCGRPIWRETEQMTLL